MGEYGFAEGMMIGEMKRQQGMDQNVQMVFDWDKAAAIIAANPSAHYGAGLAGDWNYTGGPIWTDGKIVSEDDTYVYLASFWATPQIEIDGERQDCFIIVKEDGGWDANTYWPESARVIVGEA